MTDANDTVVGPLETGRGEVKSFGCVSISGGPDRVGVFRGYSFVGTYKQQRIETNDKQECSND